MKDKIEFYPKLYNSDKEMVVINLKPDRSYSIQMKKKLINADGSDAGWLYYDIPNAYRDDDGAYVIMPSKW